ncbi:Cytochrome c oxidase subunit IV [Macrophomina phaseolina MS6]|uniref:Cytochrome c oxidase polypeptide V n=2 Tax=Macrophomina phaseolina TaxID=35725 RepID=K2SB79_MACPH|nr:Cytochrome c oxidase subunit IV [Macrophomina phaseolina MS6]KAH7025468.1 mitochondrial cytochrome c oxidase-like protein subunit V [Macrophomina phaseolina]
MLRSSILRAASSAPSVARPALRAPKLAQAVCAQQQSRQAHAISNPTLADIEKRWEQMPPQEQAELWMALRDRMKVDWKELTLQEKKAAYWIAFGPHGPRALPAPDENKKVVLYTLLGVAAAGVLFGLTRVFAGPPPATMTKEYQEASEEYLKSQGSEPITGYKGMLVQSKPGPKKDE